jgi:hypothetical protein
MLTPDRTIQVERKYSVSWYRWVALAIARETKKVQKKNSETLKTFKTTNI